MDFDNATIIDKAVNYHKRLFLEAWYSQRNSNAGNDHIYRHTGHLHISFLVKLICIILNLYILEL